MIAMDLEVRHLRLIAAVAEVGSLTKAGERIHLTQSALSHQLRNIESRLGASLFLRVGKRLVLTTAGERLLATSREVLERLQQAEDDIRRLGRDGAGVLRLTTECYTCYHWLAPVLIPYRRRFPRVEVRVDIEATRNPIAKLLAGQLDLAIVSSPVRDRRLAQRQVFDDELIVILKPNHPLTKQRFVRPIDLEHETLLIYPPRKESRVINEVLLPAGVTPRVEELPLTEGMTEMVRAGLAVAVLARWAVQPLLDRGVLVGRPLTARGVRRHWSAVTPKDLMRADHVSEFIDLLAKHAPTRLRQGFGGLSSPRPARLKAG